MVPMNKVIKFPDKNSQYEVAAAWISRIDERPLSDSEASEFRAWLNEAPDNPEVFSETARVWGSMDALAILSEIFPLEEKPTRVSAGRRWYRKWEYAAVAASLVVIASITMQIASIDDDSWEGSNAAYATAVGESEIIDLVDGSTVTANTDTSLRVAMSDQERRVVLDRGEAFFEVAHDVRRPFVVDLGAATVRAVGTAFSVYKSDSAFEVVVTEGLVEIDYTNGVLPAAQSQIREEIQENSGEGKQLLQKGQVGSFDLISAPSAPAIQIVSVPDLDITRRLSWRQGMIAFDGDTLQEVISEFGRYNDIQISVSDEALLDLRVGGYFDSHDVRGMLTALALNFDIEVTTISSNEYLLSERPQ